MSEQDKIQLFENQIIRTVWDEEREEWFFSVVDVCAVLTGSDNPRRYWSDLKRKMKAEGAVQLYENIVQLKMKSSDGKSYKTDAADTEQLLRIIQSIPSPRAEPFKLWLAQVGRERIEETIDPEQAIDRALETYPTLKTVCEGRELPAYEAATEFVSRTSSELDDLLSQLGGKQGALNTLEKLEQAEEKAANELSGLLEQLRQSRQDNPTLNDAVVKAANEAQSKHRQVEAVSKLIDASQTQNNASVAGIVEQALDAAAEKAEEVQSIIGAWSSEPGNLQRTPVNEAILERVRRSDTLRDISKYLGRFREIFAQGKHNGFAYGRGEKYSLELGNDLSRSLTSELAMLASPETLPLFLRKYQRKQIKQYRRREPIYKGAGDIICCLDESGSTSGELAAWGKAVALTLLEIAEDAGRKFALIHFSGPGSFKTDLFLPNQYGMEDKIRAAETFLDGGTDFQTPLNEAMRLMREDSFENADIVFITDGECELSESYIEELRRAQIEYRFTVTGVLLDQDNAGMDFSLKSFCQNTYRTSELTGEQVVQGIVSDRV